MLRVPFVFIPEGASVPADWLTDHPSHTRAPATFVPSRRSRGLAKPGQNRPSSITAAPDDSTAAGTRGAFAPVGVRGRRRWPPPPEIGRSGYLRETPVAAYLRANEMFARLGAVRLGARQDESAPLVASDAGSVAPDDLEYAAGVRSAANRNSGPDGNWRCAFAASGSSSAARPIRQDDGLHSYVRARNDQFNLTDTLGRYAGAAANWVASTADQLVQDINPISLAKAEVIWGHGDRHVSDLAAARIEIQQNLPAASEIGGPFWGITPNYIYRAFPMPNGDLNIGTYYPR